MPTLIVVGLGVITGLGVAMPPVTRTGARLPVEGLPVDTTDGLATAPLDGLATDPLDGLATDPLDGLAIDLPFRSNRRIRVALAGRQNDAAPQGDLLRRPMCRQPLLDLLLLLGRDDQGRFEAGHSQA